MKAALIFLAIFILASCTPVIEKYKDNNPKLDYKTLLTGNLVAYGAYFNFFGEEESRFRIESNGIYNESMNRIDMKQAFYYSDGTTEIGKAYAIFNNNDPYHFVYKDEMMVNPETYTQLGNAANIKYDLKVKRKDGSYIIVACNDWLHLIENDVAINRIKIYKFGIPVGEIIMTLIKR